MAPTRRRSSASSTANDEPEMEMMERSPKAHRLSNGSRRASNGGSSVSSPVGDMDEEEEYVDANEDLQSPAPALSGNKGKGKRRSIPANVEDGENDEEEEEEEQEQEPEDDPEDFAAKSRKMDEICRQQEEEDRLLGTNDSDGGEGGEGSLEGILQGTRARGKENEGPPLPNTKKGKKEKKDKNAATKKSEAGVVLKINVSNFMCHRKLTVPLCKQVNFINGRNGSGKSAILAALQICLGAKAHLTHRAKKMSDFIRHGWAGDAVLEVTLLNNEHGFKFEEYGESITVRRTIKQPSGGGFALVDHNGEVKSRDKGELARMLDTLNIQVDNPCAVLDQENSKKFLQGSERDKYAFFMKATDLDRIIADCEQTGDAITKMKAGHHHALSMLPRHKEIVRQLKAELKEYENIRVLKEKIEYRREQTVWAHVNETEEEAANFHQLVKEKIVEVEKLNEKVGVLELEIEEIVAGKEEIRKRIDEGVQKTQRLKQEVVDAGKELAEAQDPLLKLRAQRVTLETEKRSKKTAKDDITKKVKAARDAARRSASDQREKALHESVGRTEDTLANVERMLDGRGGEERIFQLRQALSQAGNGAAKARDEYEMSQKELTGLKMEVRNLDAGAFNPLSAIANYMPALVKCIQQEARQFSSPPVGPLGACIQLKEECKHFRVCIEGHLMKSLHNFVVSSHQDKATLMRIMKRFRGNKHFNLPTIIVQSMQPRYRPPLNPPGLLQIMQAINVTDDQAFNSLVDQCSIEKTCLFPSKEEAESRCLRGESGRYQRMPEGMFEAYYPSLGGKSCSKFSVSDGNIQTRMNTVNVRRHKSVLGVDAGTQKQEMEAQVQQTAARVEQDRSVAHEESRRAKAAEAALKQEEAERHHLSSEAQKLRVEKTRLSTQLLALQAKKSNAVDPTEELERDLEIATEELEGVVSELATLEGHMREIASQVEPFKLAKEAAKKAHKEACDATQTIQEEFEDEGQGEMKKRQRINRIHTALDKGKAELEQAKSDKERAEATVQERLEKAALYMNNVRSKQKMEWDGQRVNTEGLTVAQLEHKVVVARSRFEREKAKRNLKSKSKEEVEAQLVQAFDVYRKKKDLAYRLEQNMLLLSSERKSRTTRWKEMRDFVSRQTSRLFDQYLQDKGASGEVRFDNENKTLGLTYQKNSNDDASQCSDVKLLSGGERSFATLALLLALGKSHECPFRVMDEFDVFMDAMSRNIAIKQVVDFARKDSSRQFILITPQDLSSVTASDTCKIIKMKPPRKGDHNQATLEEAFGAGAS